jgi:hypothetical protein
MQGLRSIFRRALIFILFPVILLTAAQAQATIVQYDNRAAFEAAGTYIAESWDEFGSGTIINDGSTINGITYNYVPDIPPYNRTNVNFMVTQAYAHTTGLNTLAVTQGSGDQDYPYFTYDGVQFVFSQPIRAFGIDISTKAPNAGNFMATTDQGDVAYSVVDYFPGIFQGQFLGFSSDIPFNSVTIQYNMADPEFVSAGWTLDTMRVPLPPSLLLLGSGLAGLGLLRFRKRFKA